MTTSTETITRQIPAASYSVDQIHSSVGFAVTHNGVSTFRGTFADYEARLTGGERLRLEGSVDVGSIEIADDQLKGHLLSPEFFDAVHFPRLRFESSDLALADDGSVEVTGTLEIGGHSREVAARGRYRRHGEGLGGRPVVGLSLTTSVDRRDFGLDWQAELPGGGQALDWNVEITAELELVEEAE